MPKLEENLMPLLELTPDKVIKLQKGGVFCKNILQHIGCSKFKDYFKDAMGILHKKIADLNNVFSAIVVLQIFINYLLHALHDMLGHA